MSKDVVNPDDGFDTSRPIPVGVVNEVAYKSYIDLKAKTIDNDDFKYFHPKSDNKMRINLLTAFKNIEYQITHLPKDEQTEIKRKSAAFQAMYSRLEIYRKKAFGLERTSNKWQLTIASELDIRKGELIDLFGKSLSVQEVHRIVCEDWGMDSVSLQTIKSFRKKNYDKIAEKQKIYNEEYSDIRLSNKRSRLDELSWLYQKAKDKYSKTQSHIDYRLLLQTLKMIKDEVELNKLVIEGGITHKLETDINISVQKEIMKGLTINDIIIGRVAAKLGISSAFITERLHTSMYAKHSGFLPESGDIRDNEVNFPSELQYDWESIRKINEEKLDDKVRVIEDAVVISTMNEAQEKMLQSLNKKQEAIQISKSNINKDE